MQIECESCGTMFNKDIANCPECGLEHMPYSEVMDENSSECCETCSHYFPATDIECEILAKKWDRTHIEIDMPDTMKCGAYNAK